MFLNTASPRRSFSIPININLQGARRRQTREFVHAASPQERDWSRGVDGRGGQRARSQAPASSVGEDRAVLLGCTMMAFSVLMFFVVAITTVKPNISSDWTRTSCVLLNTSILEDWVDCRGVSTVPCVRAEVNLTETNQTALLHYDEESVLFDLECFYVPKCRMNRTELRREAERVKSVLDSHLHDDNNSSCFADQRSHPGVATLRRRSAVLALLWPGAMLGGGALLVGLVKLTQHLARLSSAVCGQATADGGGSLASRHRQGRLYRLLRRSSVSSPS